MAVIDYDKKEVNAKIVYYGPGLSGKTSNIHYIYSKLMPEHRGELMTLSTKSHRTLFFDFLPVELGEVKGLNTRFYLYTVPGQIFYNAIRKQILQEVDGIVFVADSRAKMKNENLQSFQNLEENMAEIGTSLKEVPHVIQFNKRDMPELQSLEDLHRQINKYNVPTFEATALTGNGVLKTLTTISKMVLKNLREATSIQTRSPSEGPAEAYGLSDDFVAMSLDEARQVKDELGVPSEAGPAVPAAPNASARRPAPTPPPPAAPAPPQPPAPPAPPASPPPRAAPAPPAPELHPPAPPPPPPPPAPRTAPVGPPSKLVIARWGNPQVTSGGIIKLPVVFKDQASGQEYTSLIAIQINPLSPAK